MINPEGRERVIESLKSTYFPLVVFDATRPSAAVENGRFYCENGIPFVMATTFSRQEDKTELERHLEIGEMKEKLSILQF